MISRCSFLMDLPFSTKVWARYSSRSGSVGRSPVTPKLLGVSTIPVPKCPRQMRFTITPRDRLLDNMLGKLQPAAALPERDGVLRQNRKEMPRHFAAEIVRAPAQVQSGLLRLFHFRDPVYIWEMRRLFFAQPFDVRAQRIDVRPAFRAQLPFKTPSAEDQQARFLPLRRLHRILSG